MFDDPDMVPRDMLDSMEEDYYSERKRAEEAEAEADRLREKLRAYIDALDTTRREAVKERR